MAPLICGTCIVHKEKGINSFSDWLLQGLVIRPSSSLAALHIKELLKRKGNLGKVFFSFFFFLNLLIMLAQLETQKLKKKEKKREFWIIQKIEAEFLASWPGQGVH